MSNKYISKPNIKFKKLRNKDSYMHEFLERRKKAADFALNDKNKFYYQYETPYYILRNEEELMELKRKNKNQMNSIKNKNEFYKTYRTLKNNLSHKSNNNFSSNKVIIEKENNKYYLSQDVIDDKKDKKNDDRILDKLENDIELDKQYNNQYNNIKHHTINVSSQGKKNRTIDNSSKRNSSWKNLQIQKTTSLNNYEFSENNNTNKKENEIEISNRPFLVMSNEFEYNINNFPINKNKTIKANTGENDINKIIEKYKNAHIDYVEPNNYKYYESSPKNNELQQNYNYNTTKPKNFSEPKNLFEKTKNIYSLKETKSSNNMRGNNNNYNFKYNTKINDISPIKTHYQYDIKDYNEDIMNLEKNIDSQTLNSNGNSKSATNIKLKNNIKLPKNNYKQNENLDLNIGYYKDEKSSNLYNSNDKMNNNTEKLKNVGILYKNKKYYIDNNLNYLEIPLIPEDDKKKKESNENNNPKKKNEYIEEKNYMEIKSKEENKFLEKNSKENDIQNLNNSFTNSKGKENNLLTDKFANSLENKTQQIKNPNNNNFNLSKPKENNNKIKNIKAQSYKKFSEGHNFESLKEKYESFLKPKEEEKEPNIQSRVVNSLLSSKEDLNNNHNNNNDNINNINLGNNNKSLVRNIQEKIKILKSNKSQNNTKEYNNYINEINERYTKIKLKEEKDNLTLKKFYEELIQKENNDIEKEETNKIKENKIKKEKEKTINENKTKIIQKSKRLEYIMRNLLNNKRYNYVDYHYLSNKINKNKPKNKENIDINNIQFLRNSAPDINLIVDESNDENIKIIDENEFSKLRRKNVRSARINNNNTIKNDENNKNHRKNSNILSKYYNYVSPRLIIDDINHKIMPPNELI